ncbi:MAG: lycopene cyclase domain-containing protein [Bacteroidales bacterium]
MDDKYVYALLLLGSIAYPLIQSFERRLCLFRKWKYLIPALLITALPFLAWDVWFAYNRVWSFNPTYVTGFYLFKLPWEEWLFFILVPYACVFIYEVLYYFFPRQRNPWYIFILHWGFTSLVLIAAIWNIQQIYSFIAFTAAFIILLITGLSKMTQPLLVRFYIAFLVSLIPFLIVNGVLTSLPVVIYNDLENTGIRLYTIPLEDVFYLLSLLFMNFSLYEWFRRFDKKIPG